MANKRKPPGGKLTRGKRSKVDLLPTNIRKHLDKGLRDGSITQVELLEEVNALIEAAGLPAEVKLSKAGMNRYASKIEAAGQSIREMREVTRAWVAELGQEPSGDITQMVLEVARTHLMRILMDVNDSGKTADIDMLKNMMLAVQRLEAAATASYKREKDIRAQFAKEAADKLDTVASAQGLTKDKVALFKREILGIN